MKKGQTVYLHLDNIEGKVKGVLLEQYGVNRWLIQCDSTNVVRIVREGGYKKDGCGYMEE